MSYFDKKQKESEVEVEEEDTEGENDTRAHRTFSYANDNQDQRIANYRNNQIEQAKLYDKMQTINQESKPKSQNTFEGTDTQSLNSDTITKTSISPLPLQHLDVINHTDTNPEVTDHTTQTTPRQLSSANLEVQSRSTNTDPPFNYCTPFLTLGGLIIVAAIVYAFIRYYYTSITKNQTQESEKNDSQHTTLDTSVASVDTNYIRIESTDTLDFSSNTTKSTSKSSLGILFKTTTDIECTESTEKKLMPNQKFHANDTIKILTSFYTDSRSCRPLPKGMRLRVVQVDNNGDLKVRHNSWKSNSWIFKNNYYKIQKI